jgi:hypothetical protein
MIYKLVAKFRATGSVLDKKKTKTRSSGTDLYLFSLHYSKMPFALKPAFAPT